MINFFYCCTCSLLFVVIHDQFDFKASWKVYSNTLLFSLSRKFADYDVRVKLGGILAMVYILLSRSWSVSQTVRFIYHVLILEWITCFNGR